MANITPTLVQRYDYFSPFMRASIITDPSNPDATRVPLWMNLGADSDYTKLKPVQLDGYSGSGASKKNLSSLAFLSSVNIELGLSAIPKITASLTPPYLDAREFLDSALMNWGSSELEVQIGYIGSKDGTYLSPLYRGRLDKPDITFGTDVTIGLTAQGVGGFFLRTTGANGSSGQGESLGRIVHMRNLAKTVDMTIRLDSNNLTPRTNSLLTQLVTFSTATLNVLDAIYNLARESGCHIYLTDMEVVLIAYDKLITQEPVAILRLYDYDSTVGPSNGVYPILTVSSDSRGTFLDAKVKTAVAAKIDEEKQTAAAKAEANQGRGPAANPSANQAVPRDVPASQTVDVMANASASSPADAIEATARESVNEANTTGIVLNVETIGMPNVIPGVMLQVEGVSARIDGKYVVYEVKHALSASGFQTSLTLRGNFAALSESLNETYNVNLANTQRAVATGDTATGTGGSSTVTVYPRAERGINPGF
jgi:hypothetical protein